ncbi:MAG: hypothetical protein GTO41_16250 [Burkholderiales bacterium]|nr:hypothetical protein [Burkholderiales bacterium]
MFALLMKVLGFLGLFSLLWAPGCAATGSWNADVIHDEQAKTVTVKIDGSAGTTIHYGLLDTTP